MKPTLSVLVGVFCAVTTVVNAFAPPCSTATTATIETNSGYRQPPGGSSLFMADTTSTTSDDKIAALRAEAAKAKEAAEKLRKDIGVEAPAAEAEPPKPKVTPEELQTKILPQLLSGSSSEEWSNLKESGALSNFGVANLKTFPVTLSNLESRTGLTAVSLGLEGPDAGSLDDFKYATLFVLGGSSIGGVAALALLPENIGATVCYGFALVPVLFLGLGSTAPGLIVEAIAKIKGGSNSDGSSISLRERQCRHEASHFCCGYWCGLPVERYSVDDDVARVEFGAVQTPYSPEAVAALTVTALSGCVGEGLKWPDSPPRGSSGSSSAQEDLMTLEKVVFRQSEQFMGAAAQQDITRWGALMATLLLRQYSEKYEQVVKAFERKADLAECISILER